MRRYLFNTRKIRYIKDARRTERCILCAIRDRAEDVERLEIFRSERSIVTVNFYPFAPGHILIFPVRHLEDYCALTEEEAAEIHRLTARALGIMDREYRPAGYNIGYNLGSGSGASIAHIHQHVVPRYENEVGFLDVLSGTRIMVIDPNEVLETMRRGFSERLPEGA